MRVFAVYKNGELLGAHSEFNRINTVERDTKRNGEGIYDIWQFRVDRKIVKNYRFKGCVKIGDPKENEYISIKELGKPVEWREEWYINKRGVLYIKKCHVSDDQEED